MGGRLAPPTPFPFPFPLAADGGTGAGTTPSGTRSRRGCGPSGRSSASGATARQAFRTPARRGWTCEGSLPPPHRRADTMPTPRPGRARRRLGGPPARALRRHGALREPARRRRRRRGGAERGGAARPPLLSYPSHFPIKTSAPTYRHSSNRISSFFRQVASDAYVLNKSPSAHHSAGRRRPCPPTPSSSGPDPSEPGPVGTRPGPDAGGPCRHVLTGAQRAKWRQRATA